ncbi:MAG: tRNA threonylcarbamoyladenosine dehydratase [Clostridia bacterium]|nr:tRNA threonylcarbamoyladenosine dehydratase [Clostridia bacterium]
MEGIFDRTRLLLGAEAMQKLAGSRVAVFGLGGVGGHAAEGLCRSGVGALDLFDNDEVSLTNLNRQLIATQDTIGMPKTEAMRQRLLSINPEVQLEARQLFYLPENADQVDLSRYDYVIDAIDTVSAKLELAVRCDRLGIPLISAMGAGNKLDPTKLVVTDINQTSVCRLARVMRQELRKRGVKKLKVCYSTEPALTPLAEESTEETAPGKRQTPGSTSFVPSVMGLIIAGQVVRELAGLE